MTSAARTKHVQAADLVLERMDGLRTAHVQFKRLMSVLEEGSARWAVVGGAPRTWILGDRVPRDIDIVVALDLADLDARVFSLKRWTDSGQICVQKNSFGGYKLKLVDLEVDLWSAERTHGVAMGWAKHRWLFRAVAHAAPLSSDSLVVSNEGSVHEVDFFDALACGEVRLTGRSAGQNEKLAHKVVRLWADHGLRPDLPLRGLIARHLGEQSIRAMMSGPEVPTEADTRTLARRQLDLPLGNPPNILAQNTRSRCHGR